MLKDQILYLASLFILVLENPWITSCTGTIYSLCQVLLYWLPSLSMNANIERTLYCGFVHNNCIQAPASNLAFHLAACKMHVIILNCALT